MRKKIDPVTKARRSRSKIPRFIGVQYRWEFFGVAPGMVGWGGWLVEEVCEVEVDGEMVGDGCFGCLLGFGSFP